MHKIWAALTACIVVLTGCTVKEIPNRTQNNAVGTATPPSVPAPNNYMPRFDVSGDIITTVYSEGVFVKTENGRIVMTENGTEKTFLMSARAEKDLSALKIVEGTKIIVNYNRVDPGEEAVALSLEKLL